MTTLDTGTDDLRAEIDGGVVVITMNRPDRRNAFLNRAVTGELGECMDLEVTHHVHTALTDDHREAAQAFMDKREPRFQGR
jgi:enoyl-CoA hydratase/carnithine racemase